MNTRYTDFLRIFIRTVEIEVYPLLKRLVESPTSGSTDVRGFVN